MKVLITAEINPNAGFWYKQNDIIEVIYGVEEYTSTDHGGLVNKEYCHIIQPAWEVMKEAEETGREVDTWNREKKEWRCKGKNYGWFSGEVYRIKPEPKVPEFIPYSYGDREKLRTLWIVGKKSNDQRQIVGISLAGVTIGGGHFANYQTLFDCYTHLDGSPCGKLK